MQEEAHNEIFSTADDGEDTMPARLLLLSLTLTLGFAPAPFPRPIRDRPSGAELQKLKGTWKVVGFMRRGEDPWPHERLGTKVVIAGNRLRYVADAHQN